MSDLVKKAKPQMTHPPIADGIVGRSSGMSFLAATDENYRPPRESGFYWVIPPDTEKPEVAEWENGFFFLCGGDGCDYSNLLGYWTEPLPMPAKPTTGE